MYIGGDRTKCTKLYPEICEALFTLARLSPSPTSYCWYK
jgi:hypothetical protein